MLAGATIVNLPPEVPTPQCLFCEISETLSGVIRPILFSVIMDLKCGYHGCKGTRFNLSVIGKGSSESMNQIYSQSVQIHSKIWFSISDISDLERPLWWLFVGVVYCQLQRQLTGGSAL